ncbi:hypothetical protein GCM10027062_10320 [Nocardioides hungaricus]
MSPRLGLLQIGLAGVLRGTGGLAVHLIRDAEDLSVVTISAWRMLIGALFLLVAAVGVTVSTVVSLGLAPLALGRRADKLPVGRILLTSARD